MKKQIIYYNPDDDDNFEKVISYKTSGFGEVIKNKNKPIHPINDYLEMIA